MMSALLRLVPLLAFLLLLCHPLVCTASAEIGSDLEQKDSNLRHDRELSSWQRWFKRRNRRQQNNAPSPLVGAYYYPWYHDDFHRNHGFLREQLDPPQLPKLGKYNDRNEDTYHMHLKWCMDHNIFLWVMSWFGPTTRTDVTSQLILDYVSRQTHSTDFPIKNFRFAQLYETLSLVPEIGTSGTYNTSAVKNDIYEMANSYFSHPNQLKIQGKPVVVIYLSRVLEERRATHPGLMAEVVGLMRQGAAEAGFSDIYLVGDHAYAMPSQESASAFTLLDAISNYDVFGAMGRPLYAGESNVTVYYDTQQQWKEQAKALVRKNGCKMNFRNKTLETMLITLFLLCT